MKNLRRYALYHLKGSLLRLAVIAVIALLLMFASFDTHVYRVEGEVVYKTFTYGTPMTLLGVTALLLPILEFAGFQNRRNLDTLLALPVSRAGMAAVHLANGAFQLFAVHTLCFLYMALYMQPFAAEFPLHLLLPFYAVSLLAGLAVYLLCAFLFLQAETTADGVVMMLLYTLLPFLLLGSIGNLLHLSWLQDLSHHAFLISPINTAANSYGPLIQRGAWGNLGLGPAYTMFFVFLILAAAAAVAIPLLFARHRAEKVGGISDSPFAYRTVIPLLGFSMILSNIAFFAVFAVVLAAMLLGYIIYRRSLRLARTDLIMLGIALALFLLGSLL